MIIVTFTIEDKPCGPSGRNCTIVGEAKSYGQVCAAEIASCQLIFQAVKSAAETELPKLAPTASNICIRANFADGQ